MYKNRLTKICGRQPIKNLKGYGLLNHIPSNFLKLAFHKFYSFELPGHPSVAQIFNLHKELLWRAQLSLN